MSEQRPISALNEACDVFLAVLCPAIAAAIAWHAWGLAHGVVLLQSLLAIQATIRLAARK